MGRGTTALGLWVAVGLTALAVACAAPRTQWEFAPLSDSCRVELLGETEDAGVDTVDIATTRATCFEMEDCVRALERDARACGADVVYAIDRWQGRGVFQTTYRQTRARLARHRDPAAVCAAQGARPLPAGPPDAG